MNTGMKILIHVDALSKDGDTITFKSLIYEVLYTDDISDVMTKMAKDIHTQVENAQLSKSNIVIEKISKITIKYDKYNPTRAGSYVKLPEWLSLKKASALNMKIKSVSNTVFSVMFLRSMRKTTRIELFTIIILEIMLLTGNV